MRYSIPGHTGYYVEEDGQVLKLTQTAKGEKVTVVTATKKNDSETLYVRIVGDDGERRWFRLREVQLCGRLQLVPGSESAKSAMKAQEYSLTLMGRVIDTAGVVEKEEEVVNIIHSDIVRQMQAVGFPVDFQSYMVNEAARAVFDYMKAYQMCVGEPLTIKQPGKNGDTVVENPAHKLKLLYYDRCVTALRALGLTWERTAKSLPDAVMGGVQQDMFERQEREEKVKGIVWNNS